MKDLYQHFDQHAGYRAAQQRLLGICRQTSGRQIVAIAGLPGSGKSTLADYLAQRANALIGNCVTSVSMDGFHLTKQQLLSQADGEAAMARRGAPWTFDGQAFSAALQTFKTSPEHNLLWPSFDHAIGDPIPNAITIPPETKVLLVEGLYVLLSEYGFAKAAPLIDQRWYIDSPFNQSMRNLSLRHQQVWGLSEEQAEQRIRANDLLNAEIAEQTRLNADWLISVN